MQTYGKYRVGIAGTGYIARGLISLLQLRDDMIVSSVLTRRDSQSIDDFPFPNLLTRSPDILLRNCDVLVDCTGDPVHAVDVILAAFNVGIPVVTMNTEFHVTLGSWFVGRGLISEADGDQPGSLAVLKEDAVEMGFRPLVYGNCKGFLDRNPTREAMRYWSRRLGIRMSQAISFTDGTKIQLEQALVANGLGAGILRDGLVGPRTDGLEAEAIRLADAARDRGQPISDYVITSERNAAVFIVAEHDSAHSAPLQHFKLGPGPYYVLRRSYHLCYLEIPKTIKRLLGGGRPLLTNGHAPEIGVCAIAKRRLDAGETISRGIGSFEVRGEAIRISQHSDYVPIGLLRDATLTRPIEPGTMLLLSDVELPKSRALDIWRGSFVRKVRRSQRPSRNVAPTRAYLQAEP